MNATVPNYRRGVRHWASVTGRPSLGGCMRILRRYPAGPVQRILPDEQQSTAERSGAFHGQNCLQRLQAAKQALDDVASDWQRGMRRAGIGKG